MNLKILLLGAAALLSSTSAMAVDFSFTFSTDITDPAVRNAVPGSVSGRILGLADNATGAAAQVFIDSFTAGGFSSFPTDAAAWSSVFNNSFTVTGGAITGATFHSSRNNNGFDQLFINIPIGYANGNTNYVSTGVDNAISIWNNNGFSGVTFATLDTSAVPEPATWAMMLVGFGGMGAALRSRRKVANIAHFA